MTPKVDGSTLGCLPKARREEVEYIRRHKVYTRVETCLRETGNAHIKAGSVETDNGQPQKPNVRARWVAKEFQTRKTWLVRLDAAAGGAESRAVIGCHG